MPLLFVLTRFLAIRGVITITCLQTRGQLISVARASRSLDPSGNEQKFVRFRHEASLDVTVIPRTANLVCLGPVGGCCPCMADSELSSVP
ncbi:hypothetical protein EV702DRAFT_469360 [Suillus placidus]|uniref:Secreted protein n=1 Tax=Suillus placidus TaxID=48579 RepID=A0A9P6ZS39_9AGAM|nr:hypothetical protein EV702DRAFT_469360 [Suillus placidus]